jgi:branched-chain amino acid aminotransferase
MPKPIFYFCNGKYVPRDKAVVSIHDIGLLRGYGLFESLRTYDGKPFLLREHIKRLYRGLKFAEIRPPYNAHELDRIIRATIKKNSLPNVLIRIIITGGKTQSLIPQSDPTVMVLVDPLHPFPEWQYERGLALKTTPYPRIHPAIKSIVYFSAVLETRKALRKGFHEVVYVDEKNSLLEGTTYNLFAVLPGPKLITAKEGVLAGVTADCVIKIAKKLRIPVIRSPITQSMLKKAKELFITSSNRELIPAIRVDQLKIGNGKPGPITQKLHQSYKESVAKECDL